MAKVTSYDVAKRAGVSQSAVSRTFSNGGKVAADTRAKVLAAAKALGYQPNVLARSLITGQSGMVAVIVSQTSSRYYPEIVELLAGALERAGKKMLLFYTDGRIDRVEAVLQEVGKYQVDGIIATTQFAPDKREMIRALNRPMVLMNRLDPQGEFASVICEQTLGGAQLAAALVNAGRHRVMLLSGPKDNFVARHRLMGAMDGLGSAHLDTLAGNFSYESGFNAAHQLVSAKPDAIMCMNDSMAMGVIDGLDQLGVHVPGQVWVTGFDGSVAGALARYDLTTFAQPLSGMVNDSVELLIGQMDSPDESPQSLVHQGALRVGKTAPL